MPRCGVRATQGDVRHLTCVAAGVPATLGASGLVGLSRKANVGGCFMGRLSAQGNQPLSMGFNGITSGGARSEHGDWVQPNT
jgi:hypothetical protein